mgnify:CR=1 FL=1
MLTSPWRRMQMHMSGSGAGHQQKTKRPASVMVETWTTDQPI